MQQYIGFKLNDSEYTIPILKVREIINTPHITSLPQSLHYMKGIINLRGNIVPVIDLRALMSAGGEAGPSSKVIVLASGESTYGILVDAITSVINIDEADIESPQGFMHEELVRVEGVARLDDRLVILLDTDKLVELDGLDVLGDKLVEISPTQEAAGAGKAEVPRLPGSDSGVVRSSEIRDAKDILREKLGRDEDKRKYLNTIVELLDSLTSHDYDKAEVLITELMKSSDEDFYREVGKVTRKLHDSIKEFKEALDPRIKKIANEDVPNAVDNLEFVASKTAESAEKTVEVVEKYLGRMKEFERTVKKIRSPKASVNYLMSFKESMDADLNDILVAQEFHDITGQAIGKVIDLVNTIETELVGLIAAFGVKGDLTPESRPVPDKISQEDVENLLKEFGF